MILTKIHLEKNTYLFKTFKKRGFIENDNSFHIWLDYKPNIGELLKIEYISIQKGTEKNDKFMTYLENRGKPIILRITDLIYQMYRKKNRVNILNLKVHEDVSFY